MATNRKQKKNTKPAETSPRRESLGAEIETILWLALGLLVGYLLWAPRPLSGLLGELFSNISRGLMGTVAYVLPLLFFYLAWEAPFSSDRDRAGGIRRPLYIFLFLYFVMVFISAVNLDIEKLEQLAGTPERISAWQAMRHLWISGANPGLLSHSTVWSGGLIGGISSYALSQLIGTTGCLIITLSMLLALAVLIFNVSWQDAVKKTAHSLGSTGHKISDWSKHVWQEQKTFWQERRIKQKEEAARMPQQMGKEKFNNMTEEQKNQKSTAPLPEAATPVESPPTFGFPTGNWLKDDFGESPIDVHYVPPQATIRPAYIAFKTSYAYASINHTEHPDAEESTPEPEKTLPEFIPEADTTPVSEPETPQPEPQPTSDFSASNAAGSSRASDIQEGEVKSELAHIASGIKEGKVDTEDWTGRENWDDRSGAVDSSHGKERQMKIFDHYLAPPTNLLIPDEPQQAENKEEIRLLGAKLEKTLNDFGVDAEVVHFITGPTITRFEIKPGPGVKVSKIVNLENDIALALAATSVRIEAPIPGKSALGIEIPNKHTQAVRLRDIIESEEFTHTKHKLTAALGRNIQGDPILCNLSSMPHLLIAGATGSGKSVCINTILISLLYQMSPRDLRLIMIDPKVVELSVYNGIPHLALPVVTNPKKAYAVLEWSVQEMERRYQLFAENSVRDFKAYNELVAQDQVEDGEHLPYLLIVIDELSDLMATTPTEVEDAIARLTSMARAAGIHLIIATQRPSVDVITGVIKANIPSRISFAVASQVDSRTILDMGGAEHLLGKGDMLYYPQSASKPLRGQGAFVTDGEVEKVITYLTNHYESSYNEDLAAEMRKVGSEGKKGDLAIDEEDDELLYEALKTVMENDYASVSLLQRRLSVGYPRAARMVDAMHARGWIGPFEGSKPRKLTISKEEAKAIYEENT